MSPPPNKLLKLTAFRVACAFRSPVVDYHGLGCVDRSAIVYCCGRSLTAVRLGGQMDRLVFHEDETGIATLHDLAAFQFHPEYPSSDDGTFGSAGVWSPIRENTGLAGLAIAPAELSSLVPVEWTRIERVSSYYGAPENLSALPTIAFALDNERAVLADISSAGVVASVWILDHSTDPSWVRPPLLNLSVRWPLLVWDACFDFQFPLARVDRLDAWLAALRSRRSST